MKSLFEQFGGTYRKENNYVIRVQLMSLLHLRKWKNSFVYGKMENTYTVKG